jgi:hypothetical protein
MAGDEHLLEATINLAQFPEDQNQNNHDYEQQEWDVHSFLSRSKQLEIISLLQKSLSTMKSTLLGELPQIGFTVTCVRAASLN